MSTDAKSENRFEGDASRYASYLETPEGRLRADLVFANLLKFLPGTSIEPLHALDLGCGTGATAVRLARLGIQVTLLDSSPKMLGLAERTIVEARVRDRATLKHGDAARLAELFQDGSFDIILCHNLLEFVGDPRAILCGAARLMRDASILSVLVRNQAGEVMKAALQSGDLAAAEQKLTAEWGTESLYGGKVQLFALEALEAMLADIPLTLAARRGVRTIADYLPPQISRTDDYERIFALERKLGNRSEFVGTARYTHYLARRSGAGIK